MFCIRKEFQISLDSANAITAGAFSIAYFLFGWPHPEKNVCVKHQTESSKMLVTKVAEVSGAVQGTLGLIHPVPRSMEVSALLGGLCERVRDRLL